MNGPDPPDHADVLSTRGSLEEAGSGTGSGAGADLSSDPLQELLQQQAAPPMVVVEGRLQQALQPPQIHF